MTEYVQLPHYEIHLAQTSCIEPSLMASAVPNEENFPHSPREIAIEGILLPLAVANEFHGKYFRVSDEICA